MINNAYSKRMHLKMYHLPRIRIHIHIHPLSLPLRMRGHEFKMQESLAEGEKTRNAVTRGRIFIRSCVPYLGAHEGSEAEDRGELGDGVVPVLARESVEFGCEVESGVNI